jgi:phosphoglycerate dehydrogenase-like enzyme
MVLDGYVRNVHHVGMRFPMSPSSPVDPDRRQWLTAAFAMRPGLASALFGPPELERIRAVADIDETTVITDIGTADPRLLAGLDVAITGWGAPLFDAAALDAMPRLRAIVHAGGTVKRHVAADAWERGILVTTAADANAYPVAEYTLAAILLAGKDVPALAAGYAADPGFDASSRPGIGNYHRTVGILGASRVGRRVIDLLGQFDFGILLHDPYLPNADPVLTRARRVDLDDLFRLSSIVSIHAPLLPDTAGLVGADQLALMSPGSVLINTARGAIVDHEALTHAVRTRGLRAVLDVTDPEPLPADHPLRQLPGVILTPHVAGSLGNELRRLGDAAASEVELLAAGQPPRCPIGKQALLTMA